MGGVVDEVWKPEFSLRAKTNGWRRNVAETIGGPGQMGSSLAAPERLSGRFRPRELLNVVATSYRNTEADESGVVANATNKAK